MPSLRKDPRAFCAVCTEGWTAATGQRARASGALLVVCACSRSARSGAILGAAMIRPRFRCPLCGAARQSSGTNHQPLCQRFHRRAASARPDLRGLRRRHRSNSKGLRCDARLSASFKGFCRGDFVRDGALSARSTTLSIRQTAMGAEAPRLTGWPARVVWRKC